MVKTENAPGKGEQEQSGVQLEETQGCWRRWRLGCIRGPTGGGEGGFLPAAHLAALPVPGLGVGGGDALSPGVLWALTRSERDCWIRGAQAAPGVPSGSRGQSCTEPRPRQATQGPTSDNQSPFDPQMERHRWGSCLPWAGWCCQRPQPGMAEAQPPHFPVWGPLLGLPVPFLCLRNPPPLRQSGSGSPAPHSPVDAGPSNTAKVRARARARAGSGSRGPQRIAAAGWAAGTCEERSPEPGAWTPESSS